MDKNRQKEREFSEITGRLLSATQAMPSVLCSELFVNIPSMSLKNRLGILKSPVKCTKMNTSINAMPYVERTAVEEKQT